VLGTEVESPRPHFRQNLAPARFDSPHPEQTDSRRASHSSQKTPSAAFSCWHRGHCILEPPSPQPGLTEAFAYRSRDASDGQGPAPGRAPQRRRTYISPRRLRRRPQRSAVRRRPRTPSGQRLRSLRDESAPVSEGGRAQFPITGRSVNSPFFAPMHSIGRSHSLYQDWMTRPAARCPTVEVSCPSRD
jgi:hypothetical protein